MKNEITKALFLLYCKHENAQAHSASSGMRGATRVVQNSDITQHQFSPSIACKLTRANERARCMLGISEKKCIIQNCLLNMTEL
jgi:hypothetical protein